MKTTIINNANNNVFTIITIGVKLTADGKAAAIYDAAEATGIPENAFAVIYSDTAVEVSEEYSVFVLQLDAEHAKHYAHVTAQESTDTSTAKDQKAAFEGVDDDFMSSMDFFDNELSEDAAEEVQAQEIQQTIINNAHVDNKQPKEEIVQVRQKPSAIIDDTPDKPTVSDNNATENQEEGAPQMADKEISKATAAMRLAHQLRKKLSKKLKDLHYREIMSICLKAAWAQIKGQDLKVTYPWIASLLDSNEGPAPATTTTSEPNSIKAEKEVKEQATQVAQPKTSPVRSGEIPKAQGKSSRKTHMERVEEVLANMDLVYPEAMIEAAQKNSNGEAAMKLRIVANAIVANNGDLRLSALFDAWYEKGIDYVTPIMGKVGMFVAWHNGKHDASTLYRMGRGGALTPASR